MESISNHNQSGTSTEKISFQQQKDINFNNINEKKDQISQEIGTALNTTQCLSYSQIPLNCDSSILCENKNSNFNIRKNSLQNRESISAEESFLTELKLDPNSIFLFESQSIPYKIEENSRDVEKDKCAKLPFDEYIKCVEVVNNKRKFKTNQKSYWEVIEESLIGLSDSVDSFKSLEKCIKSFNIHLRNSNFDIMHRLSNEDKKLMPRIIKLALQLPSIILQPIPLLCQKENKTLFLKQSQISCLLANAFLCTYPRPMKSYPSINFNNLFKRSGYKNDSSVKLEKLKCIFNYFKRVLSEPPKGVVSFERRYLENNQIPKWNKSSKKLSDLKIFDKGSIESDGKDMLQVDFANKLVGGGVLNHGCVQEEIRFCINPELIIARFLTQQLLDEEVLIIKGTEQYNTYDGYGNSFKWVADYKDLTPTDEWGRRNTTIVAMDAIRFTSNNTAIQYDRKNINRELNKAYCGFYEEVQSNKTPIATGNWGCGAFNGDQILKALIQLMAASECERDLVYFTFNDSSLKKELEKFYTFVSTKNFTVKHLYKALTLYDGQVIKCSKSYQIDLFEFITHNLEVIFKT